MKYLVAFLILAAATSANAGCRLETYCDQRGFCYQVPVCN